MNTQLWWYVARSGGLVAWALVSASVLWGLVLSTKSMRSTVRPNWVLDLHRFLGGLSVVFTAVHVLGILADKYVHFGLTEVLVPFTGTWHPDAVAGGIVAAYLLVAVEVTSLLRNKMSKRAWRLTHFASFPLFIAATLHLATAGTDRHSLLLRLAVAAVVVAVTAFTVRRVWQIGQVPSQPTRPIPARRSDSARR